MKRVLIISPHWPPLNAPDLQRARLSLPYFRENGWEPVVLAIADQDLEGTREPELERTIPPDIEIHRCRALSLRRTRRLGLRNSGLRAWPGLLTTGSRLLRERKFDLVYFTNTQFVTFTLGRVWRRRHGVPYVFDMQDPWRTNYYQRPGSRPPPGGWKYQLARLMAWLLEGWSLRRASGLISVSPDYIDDLRARYPWFRDFPSAVIPFGASPADLAEAAKLGPAAVEGKKGTGECHFLYTGAAGPIVPQAVSVLFQALRAYRGASPERARRLRFHFVGTSYAPPGTGTRTVAPIAERFEVADLVSEVPHRIGHLEALRLQMDADVLLLPGSSDLAYSPSKLFSYCLTRRPILALVYPGSVLERQLAELRCATTVGIAERDRTAATAELHKYFDRALAGDRAPGFARNDALLEREYAAPALTRRQCELFERALASRHG